MPQRGESTSCGLSEALSSPFLQASEPQALRALLRWAACAMPQRESNMVWSRAQSVGRRGCRRRDAGDAALRDALAPLAPLLRLEHLPPDHDLLQQVVRRGIVAGAAGERAGAADAWLGRGSYRPPRCFLPYLDEIKALLEDQAVPEAELARARRERYLQRIPDTLYMVAAGRVGARSPRSSSPTSSLAGAARACVSPRVLAGLRARARHLRAAPPARRAAALHDNDTLTVYKQIALRAVREMSLPDACAELLIAELDSDRERDAEQWECGADRQADSVRVWCVDEQPGHECCRSLGGSGSVRCASTGSLRAQHAASGDTSRAGTCRREGGSRSADAAQHRQSVSSSSSRLSGAACSGGSSTARLSAAVPDVAMAPNANTHLLTARDYFRHAPHREYSGGGVLQLDLGDGATHTPRPGSRAQRAGTAQSSRQQREHTPAMSCLRSRADEDELRAAIELSVIRAYSSSRPPLGAAPLGAAPLLLGGAARAPPPAPSAPPAPRAAATLPADRTQHALHATNSARGRASASPQRLSERSTPTPQHAASRRLGYPGRASGAPGGSGGPGGAGPSRSPSPSPAPSEPPHERLFRQQAPHSHYRLEASYSGSSSGSRHTYA
ncbi:hypothetical protein PYW07_012992 [Mythimna separata]|uniref:Uncharacterized protein n=1 Tax=Mythimna separata TaxID=271217 RepID=A0AAD7Y9M3_MYTSE|nr:hypothetical protein PYW07_012992 [Mythimna separata]